VDGKPKPKVTWYKGGVEIIPSTDFIMDEFEDGTCVLTIAEVYPDDVGEVVAVAENPLGVTTTTTFLENPGKSQSNQYIWFSIICLLISFMGLKIAISGRY